MAASTTLTRHAGSFIAISVMLLALLGASLLLGGCAAQHHLTPARPPRPERFSQAELDRTRYETVPDSLAPAAGSDARTKASVLQRWRQQFQHDAARTQTGPATMPRKCKGCVFNTVAGDQTNSTAGKKATVAAGDNAVASHIEKKAGPAVVGSDSATLNNVGTGNLAATNGDGNTTTQTKADVEPPSIGATIAARLTGPLGWALGVAALGVMGYGVYRLWPLLRRKDSPTNQV